MPVSLLGDSLDNMARLYFSSTVRTVHSVLNRSPRHLLREVILVDDASERAFLGKPLDDYMANLSAQSGQTIRILRAQERIGLIQARIRGAHLASGKVLTFLDAHCETTYGWLQPLLHRIQQQPKTVVCPVIDIINDQTFAYSRSFDSHWGAINWGLSFRWFSVGHRELKRMRLRNYDHTSTYRSPIMAGGLFSIERQFFFDIGTYDSALKIWGGENIEMSLRVWQCGGRVEVSCLFLSTFALENFFANAAPLSLRSHRAHTLPISFAVHRRTVLESDRWVMFSIVTSYGSQKFGLMIGSTSSTNSTRQQRIYWLTTRAKCWQILVSESS